MIKRRLFLLFVIASWFVISVAVRADTSDLTKRQNGVADRYQRLEELLLRLAEMEASENPERAALLRRAAKQSSDQFVLSKLRAASESLENQEFQKAVDNQGGAKEELDALLKLLMSEDRSKRIRKEKERYAKLIKDLKRNLNNQRSTRARTENGADMKQVEKEQGDVTDRSEELRKRLSDENQPIPSEAKHESESPKENGAKRPGPEQPSQEDSKPSDSHDSDSKNSEQKSGEQKPNEQKPNEQKPGQQRAGEPSPPSQQPSLPQTPEQEVEKQLEQAIEKMKLAESDLKDVKREEATQKQREAEENLRAAIDRLERILRQLREEEMQRELAKLEARLRSMSAMQAEVLKKTEELAATPKLQRDRSIDLKAGDLSFEEKKITLEADRAMLLLREEGSSVAFPEVVAGIRLDTTRVAERLGRAEIDTVTQGIERDILAGLEEMIAALQKAQRELEKQKKQQQQGGPGQSGQGEQPLVQEIAELKLLRTMETRIKSTTDRYSGLLESGESSGESVLPLLQDLAERQSRLYQIARDLVLKRNQ